MTGERLNSLRSTARRLATHTGTDDDESVLIDAGLPAVRAKVLWISSFLVAVIVAAARFADGHSAWPIGRYPLIYAGAPVVLIMQGLWCLVRGSRLSDDQASFILTTWPVMVGAAFTAMQPVGAPVSGELTLLVSVLMVTVLSGRRRNVVLITAVALVAMVWIVWDRLGSLGLAPITMMMELPVFLTVVLTVRTLREIAVRAVARAARNEVTDPLTGLVNRRGLERQGPRYWDRRGIARLPLAVIVLDIDHFKRVNDTMGHAAGDTVIQTVASVLANAFRPEDLVVRLGGEEFLVLASVEPGSAAAVAERLREAIVHAPTGVTVSLGVLEVVPAPSGESLPLLLRAVDQADQALGYAKRSGRNQVVMALSAGESSLPDLGQLAPGAVTL